MSIFTHKNNGQALISLMYFVLIGIIVTSAAVLLMANNSLGTTKTQEGTLSYSVAESGAEEGLMQLLRNPTGYTSETLSVNNGTATISVTGSYPGTALSPMKVKSIGTQGNFVRKIEVDVYFSSGVLTIQSWKEIYN